MKRLCMVILAAGGLWASAAPADDEAAVILDMDTVRHRPGQITAKDQQKVPAGTVEDVEGKFGRANLFGFVEGARGGFATAWVVAGPEWDKAAGFSFWVKGDGSSHFGGLELIDGTDYKLRYGLCFPIDSTEWTKITVPWEDLLPELSGPLIDPRGGPEGYAPSRFRNVWFGKWTYWRTYPAIHFAIDQVQLEKTLDVDRADYTPAVAGCPKLLAKLQAGKPVTIVTMGDSLSDKNHWANRPTLWSELLGAQLQTAYKSPVTLVNPAIGGTTLSQNLILMPRWLQDTPAPDLVTVCFGFNDFDSGVRGERMAQYLRAGVDRIRRLTKGQSEILLITTCPAHGRWRSLGEMSRAFWVVAREKKTAFADIATAFHAPGSPDAALAQEYWASDKTHLGKKGHEVVAQTVLKAIVSGGAADVAAGEKAWWQESAQAAPATAPAPTSAPAGAAQ